MAVASLTVSAQLSDQITATLQVGEQTSVFYGPDAFNQAYAAAPDSGSVVTLSSGTFTLPEQFTILKSMEVYGVGIVNDTISANPIHVIYPTILVIDNYYTLKIGSSECKADIRFEGVSFEGPITVGNLNSLYINRCDFQYALSFQNAFQSKAVIRQSLLRLDFNIGSTPAFESIAIENSIIRFLNFSQYAPISLDHCLVLRDNGRYDTDVNMPPLTYSHSILPGKVREGGIVNNCILITNEYQNCIFEDCVFGVTSLTLFGTDGLFGRGNITYDPTCNYKLVDPVIGNDGTEIGIWGGNYPWNPIPSIPRIIESNVAKKTDANGILQVTVKGEARPRADLNL